MLALLTHLIAVDAQARRGSDTLAGRAMVVERRRERPHAVDARPPCQAARRPHAIPSKSGDALPGSCSSSTLSRPVTSLSGRSTKYPVASLRCPCPFRFRATPVRTIGP